MQNSDYKDIKIIADYIKEGSTICNIYFFCEKKSLVWKGDKMRWLRTISVGIVFKKNVVGNLQFHLTGKQFWTLQNILINLGVDHHRAYKDAASKRDNSFTHSNSSVSNPASRAMFSQLMEKSRAVLRHAVSCDFSLISS